MHLFACTRDLYPEGALVPASYINMGQSKPPRTQKKMEGLYFHETTEGRKGLVTRELVM
jgi:hypothetical protein